jgi:cytidyltransferase-like protein
VTNPAGASIDTLDLLREVYLEEFQGNPTVEKISRRLAKSRASVRSALRNLAKRGLVSKGRIRLTIQGRRRLKVVMIGGAFEIIHPGHVYALSEARKLGNTLVVVVATDESVQRNKGRAPATGQESRVMLVSSLRQVDLAIPGNKGSIFDILVKIRPDIVALGYDQRHNPEEIVQEAARRGLSLSTARLDSPFPDVKTSKILLSM